MLGRYRPQRVDGSTLFASRGLEVLVSDDHGETFRRVGGVDAGWLQRWTSRVRFLERVGRLGFHDLEALPDGTLVGIIRGHIVRRPAAGGPFRPVFRISRGSRPLRLCLHPENTIYFGEYFSNPRREPVHVFGSGDGRHWERVHTFPAGAIRHVHGLVYDRFREGVWVLTGDDDSESGLWFTEDGFGNLERVLGGSQHTRAVSLIPVEEGIIVPTDSPRIENRIQHLKLPECRLRALCPIPGSAFHAVETAGLYLVSTVSEPGSVSDEEGAVVLASLDGTDWYRLDRLPPDLLSHVAPFARRLLRYPEVSLTPGRNETPYVFGFGRSVRGAEGRLLRWPRSGIVRELRDASSGVG